MKNMTLDQFKYTYEDWKSSGLYVHDYCCNTDLEEGKLVLLLAQETDRICFSRTTRICSGEHE